MVGQSPGSPLLLRFQAASIRKHLPEDGDGWLRIDCGHLFKEPLHRYGADLVEGYRRGLALQANRITGRKVPDGRGDRCKDDRSERLVHLIRGDDECRTGFLISLPTFGSSATQ